MSSNESIVVNDSLSNEEAACFTPQSPRLEESPEDDTPTRLLQQLINKRNQRLVDTAGNNNDANNFFSTADSDVVLDQRDDGEKNKEGSPELQPFLSILNVVVDHSMEPPTPMEPEEFNQMLSNRRNNRSRIDEKEEKGREKQQIDDEIYSSSLDHNILVPVLRIFGPIIRHDNNSSKSLSPAKTVQSGCLYVHGAYPYLLARPVVAGPDGSVHHNCHIPSQSQQITIQGHVNWDDVESVRKIIKNIHSKLEATIQSTLTNYSSSPVASNMEDSNNNSSNNNNNGQNKDRTATKESNSNRPTRVIRRITIVVGRGFYTYCPGPPAPFLRIEYYDPKLRWKVKLALERGLDLPLSYHPDPQQYDANISSPAPAAENGGECGADCVLRFHCYEAHIPYTMQFFKDQNLSGMSYIHVENGRFRNPLPRTLRHRYFANGTAGCRVIDNKAGFLLDNVSKDDIWKKEDFSTKTGFQGRQSEEATNLQLIKQNIKMNNASDIVFNHEIDQWWIEKETVCDIEFDTTTEQLLNINDVITSLPDDPKEREQVHWRAVPSLREIWRQERRRMSSLLKPKDDFLSNLSAPQATADSATTTMHANRGDSDRSKTAVVAANVSGHNNPLPFTLNIKRDASLPGARLAVTGMKSLFRLSPGLEDDFRRAMRDIVNRHSQAVRRIDERLQARSLRSTKSDHLTPPIDEAIAALGALGGQFECGHSQLSDISSPDGFYDEKCNSQSIANFPRLSQPHVNFESSDLNELSELSQRIDRGDHFLSLKTQEESTRVGYVEDYIDPETLTPFEDHEDEDDFLDEEEGMSEKDLERTLSTLATQMHETYPDSPSKKHEHHEDKNPFGLSSTLSPVMEYDSDRSDEDGREEDVLWEKHRQNRSRLKDLLEMTPDDDSSALDSQENNDSYGQYQENNEDYEHMSRDTVEDSSNWNAILSAARSSNGDVTILGMCQSAPTRADVAVKNMSKRLHPLCHDDDACHEWLTYRRKYSFLREPTETGKASFYIREDANYLEPVVRPPTRRKVVSWSRRKRKGEVNGRVRSRHKKQRRETEPEIELQFDDNSRKLTAVQSNIGNCKNKLARVAHQGPQFSSDIQEVEEAVWNVTNEVMSQTQSQPLSQLFEGKTKEEANFISERPKVARKDTASSTQTNEMTHTESQSSGRSSSQSQGQPLQGIGQQGGRVYVQGGGGLKAKTGKMHVGSDEPSRTGTKEKVGLHHLPSPLTVMTIEIHVQCRTGRAGVQDSREIAMKPNSDKDIIFAIMYAYGRDPGGGEAMQILERGCIFVPTENDNDGNKRMPPCVPKRTFGVSSKLVIETVRDERQLLLRLVSIVRWKDPDMLLSWETQGAGLGYLIERGSVLGKPSDSEASCNPNSNRAIKGIDMVRLLGRTPITKKSPGKNIVAKQFVQGENGDKGNSASTNDGAQTGVQWAGSGLGSDWDDRVGAGAAAASISGRLVFSGWKIIAEEVKHPNASYLPAIVATVLNKRIPYHDDLKLTTWYSANKGRERWRVLNHRLAQCLACLQLFDKLDVLGRAGEAARLSGVEFSQSFPGIRGSQYKVEGVLLRALKSLQSDERGAKKGRQRTKLSNDATKPELGPGSSLSNESNSQTQSPWKLRRSNAIKQSDSSGHDLSDRCYFFYSPSIQDTQRQEALECQALTLEPQSGFYRDPVVVCDFTALYPSLVIAYNLCYSTCSGKLDYHSTRKEMRQLGRTTCKLGPFHYGESRTATVLSHHIKSLQADDFSNSDEDSVGKYRKDRAYVVPTGSIFLSESVLKGVLPQILDEMLSTRAMLKRAAKEYKKNVPNLAPSILRQLEARQLALKYVANVTYGYTSATFSGRCAMPLLADTIVECGRRTLSNAINLANEWGSEKGGKWSGAEVIYGDTDSLFVRLPGRSVEEAFEFGETFCQTVTASNPPPVQLKLEKVYSGSMMQTKKKYCGMKYESSDQKKPTFEAKGIETVRRDQCALTQKVLRNALITLFRSGLDAVREYLFRQWSLILAGRLPISDFILTGRVRTKYRGGRVGPVQAVLARRLAEADPGRIVRHKERLAYVIVATPGLTFKLKDCVLTPTELLEQWDAFSIHSTYYITKHVNAALQRCLCLTPHRVNVAAWYDACPKPRRRIHFWPITRSGSSVMISSYFGSDTCSLCGSKCKAQGRSRAVACSKCKENYVKASYTAMSRLNKIQNDANTVAKECSKCNGCFESSGTFAFLKDKKVSNHNNNENKSTLWGKTTAGGGGGIVTPIANCSCIDCPNTFERHRLREGELEALELCESLNLN